uniref:Disintegrin domain-containing protein n=1 Tax=Monodon monoceros TaxID=40151 RepID=A0A8C6F2F4_MONMO
MGSDVKIVTQKVIQIIGFVNTMLTQLKLTVRISSIEIWSNKNKISTTRHPNHILYRLLEWKYEFLSQPHHTAYLFAICFQNCTHPDCCDPRTCTKKKNKICGSGECCTRGCKIKPVNTPCRQPVDECDFLEFCDGNNAHCVPDTYARDGQSCDSGDSFCYKGRCRSFTRQCRKLIGGASRGAPFACFDEINSRGDKFGNCGRKYCNYPNMLCGKLVCTWPHKALVTRTNLSVIYTHVRDDMCTSTFLNTEKTPRNTLTTVEKPEDRDQTFVEDGTVCGPEMYCLRFNCVELKYHVNFQSCNSTRDCNSNGVCNNFNNCHCKMGFAPPRCKPMADDFGSIDDGHRVIVILMPPESFKATPFSCLLGATISSLEISL